MRTTKFAMVMAGALALAAPLAASVPADAAPHGGGMMGGHLDAFHDRNHRPPQRSEHRPPMPHGHYRWRNGSWAWRGNQWVWAPGIWLRF